VGFGTELLFIIVLGLVMLGPKRLHAVLGHLARAKAEFEKLSRGFQSQLESQLEAATQDDKDDAEALPIRAEDSAEPDGADSLTARTS
jgi:Sec-independent protein translocase protein TatA